MNESFTQSEPQQGTKESDGQESRPRFHVATSQDTSSPAVVAPATAWDIQRQFEAMEKRQTDERTLLVATTIEFTTQRKNQLEEQRDAIDGELDLMKKLLAALGIPDASAPVAAQTVPRKKSAKTQQNLDENRKRFGAPVFDALWKRRGEWLWARDLSPLINGASVKKALSWWIEQGVVEVQGVGPGTQYRAK